MGLNWVLSAPDGPHVGPMNLSELFYEILFCNTGMFLGNRQLSRAITQLLTEGFSKHLIAWLDFFMVS